MPGDCFQFIKSEGINFCNEKTAIQECEGFREDSGEKTMTTENKDDAFQRNPVMMEKTGFPFDSELMTLAIPNKETLSITKKCFIMAGQLVRKVFSPSITPNNIKFLGCRRALDIERQKSFESFALHPLSNLRQYWDFLLMLMMSLNLFLIPLDISFVPDTFEDILTLSDILCVFDICLNFITSYVIPGSKAFQHQISCIAKHYLKTCFVVDLISCLPLHYVIMQFQEEHESFSLGLKGASNALKYIKILKLVRLVKLLRLSRIVRSILVYEEVYRLTTGIMRYFKLVSMMMVIAHWNGCIQFLIPMLQDFPVDSWVIRCQIKEEEWYIQYGWAIFKTLSHMLCIGYGRFIPKLLSEACITIFTMVTGATFYALFVANAMAYMVNNDHAKVSFDEKNERTKEYLAFRQIPSDLRKKIDAYFMQKYRHGRCFDEKQMLSELSKPLKAEMIKHICRDILANIRFLSIAPYDVMLGIFDAMSDEVFLEGDDIVQEGEKHLKLFYVREGEVDIIVNNRLVNKLGPGDYFGMLSLLVPGKSFYSVRATSTCNVIVIHKDFTSFLLTHIRMREVLIEDAVRMLLQFYHFFQTADDDELFDRYMELLRVQAECLLECAADCNLDTETDRSLQSIARNI